MNNKKGKLYFTIVGILVGIANGLFGSGGGMIAVPMLEGGGLEPQKSHATSIALTLMLSVVSGIIYYFHGTMNFEQSIKFIPLGIVGAVIGAKLLKKLSGNILHRIFGGIMIIAGIRLLLKG